VLESSVEAIAAGGFHSCAIFSNANVVCWGNNFFGQLGNGALIDRAPVDVLWP